MLHACAGERGGEHRELTLPLDLGQRRHRAVFFLMKPASEMCCWICAGEEAEAPPVTLAQEAGRTRQ